MLYPAILRLQHDGKVKFFKLPKDVAAFLNKNGIFCRGPFWQMDSLNIMLYLWPSTFIVCSKESYCYNTVCAMQRYFCHTACGLTLAGECEPGSSQLQSYIYFYLFIFLFVCFYKSNSMITWELVQHLPLPLNLPVIFAWCSLYVVWFLLTCSIFYFLLHYVSRFIFSKLWLLLTVSSICSQDTFLKIRWLVTDLHINW